MWLDRLCNLMLLLLPPMADVVVAVDVAAAEPPLLYQIVRRMTGWPKVPTLERPETAQHLEVLLTPC